MGFYNSYLRKLGWSKEDLVREANDLALNCWHLGELPSLEAKTVGKMGLKGPCSRPCLPLLPSLRMAMYMRLHAPMPVVLGYLVEPVLGTRRNLNGTHRLLDL